jgi:hypothetical protein
MALSPDLLKHYRGYASGAYTGKGFTLPDLTGIQAMNKLAANTLAQPAYLNLNWQKLSADSGKLVEEMTNKLNNPRETQLYCDARKWVNAEVGLFGVAKGAGRKINRRIEDDEGYYIYVEYNATTSSRERQRAAAARVRQIPDQHFFNLVLRLHPRPLIRGDAGLAPQEEVQLAHLTVFTNVDPVMASRHPRSYTPIGFIHLKDDLSLGELIKDPREATNARGIQYPMIPNPAIPIRHRAYRVGKFALPASGRSPARAFLESKLFDNFRRYFIHIERDASGNPTNFLLGLQKQDGAVSQMAITFNSIAINVLQDYMNAGFSKAGFVTAANTAWFIPNVDCKPAAGPYTPATNLGKQTNVQQPRNQRTLPLVGGKVKKNRNQTRKNRG